tara:strand:- start:385 stop:570 length:186 start_codon:yes stop_codon:yes gene_type:complete
MTQNRKTKHQKFMNFVAKNMEKFNRPVTHLDKKKESKINGYTADLAWIDELDEITDLEKKL